MTKEKEILELEIEMFYKNLYTSIPIVENELFNNFIENLEIPRLKILETVRLCKVLGLVIQDNLKWNEHIGMTVPKASKKKNLKRFKTVAVVYLIH